MSATYDPTIDETVYAIRLNTFGNDTVDPCFSDQELLFFYAQCGENLKRTYAAVLRTTAIREAFVQKVIRIMQLSTNGAATAKILNDLAKEYETQADSDDETANPTGAWAIANPVLTPFNLDELRRNSLYEL